VYLVERTTAGVVQRAALKVLTRSAAGPFFTERFAREQHILASLDHPNITRLLDAGLSAEGEPYLTMEYVDGLHLDVYCDDRSLGIPDRLQLFLRVCEAVAYAHRRLVVHLDLKPSNILVTEAGGIVKLLDFGTSKLIQPDSLLTTTVMATPAYASPEQLRNEPVTTVCDVYALGAILFELLSGRRPNQDSSVAVMIERSMKELPPESVTAAVTAAGAGHRGLTETRLRSLLTGDLATIVAKCITPRPRDRYVTVEALITDVQRYLAGRPILARPQTTTYRLSKFVRRNRTMVASVSVMLCCLLAVAGYAAWKRQQAYREGQRALQMQTFMSQLFKLANTTYMGKPAATIPEFLRMGVRLIPSFIPSQADRCVAQLSLAKSMFENKDYVDAEPVFLQTMAEARSIKEFGVEAEAESYAGATAYLRGDHKTGLALEAEALSLVHHDGVTTSSRVLIEGFYANDRETSGFRTDENRTLLEETVNESRNAHLPEQDQAQTLVNLAYLLSFRGETDEAQLAAESALAIYKRESYAICDQANVAVLLGNIRTMRADFAGSIPYFQRGEEGYVKCSGASSLNALAVQIYMANAWIKLGKSQPSIEILESVITQTRMNGSRGSNLSAPLVLLARAYTIHSQFAKAEDAIREAVSLLHEQGENPHGTQIAAAELVWAHTLDGEGQFARALQHDEIAENNYGFSAAALPAPRDKAHAAEAHALHIRLLSEMAVGSTGLKK
jgi:tetratricopeptide (TPR) repeat protein